jgi:hypothetical protein
MSPDNYKAARQAVDHSDYMAAVALAILALVDELRRDVTAEGA